MKKKNGQTKALQKFTPDPLAGSEAAKTRAALLELSKAAGVPVEIMNRMVAQTASALVWPKPENDSELIAKSIASLVGHAPRSAMEANLAVHMTATSETALLFLYRASLADQPSEIVDRIVARAVRLMRLHLEQIEAMQRLKGKAGQQKVTVEHVHVHEGGQAIVGAVSAMKGEGPGPNEDTEDSTA